MCDNDGMKSYVIPVTHTAETVVEHTVQAKNMQDAKFQLGLALAAAVDPFDCVTENGTKISVTVSAGTPKIVEADQLELASEDAES